MMESMEMPVTLIVKAPNQQIEDQTIQCQLNWTVHKLKSHLSEVYPSKPRTEEQKLIYSGHLLHDSSTLKEVLRRYEGQEDGPSTHTLHLVCSASSPQYSSSQSSKTPPVTRDSAPQNGSSSSGPTVGNQVQDINSATNEEISRDEVSREGLRHRFTSEGQAEVDGGFSVGGGVFINPWAAWALQTGEGMEQIGMSSSSQQQWQMQWMQQAYAQYLAQYMQLVQSGAAPQGFFVPTPFGAGMSSDGSGYNNSESTGPGTPVFTPPLNNNNNEPAAQDAVADRGDEGADALGADGLPPGQNRDWIDWIYFGSRFMVFLSIIYFYSTLARVLLVTGIGMAMYLWKVGFFRLQQPPVPNVQRDPAREADAREPHQNNPGEWNQRPADQGAEAAPEINNETAEREGATRPEEEEARANRGHPVVEEVDSPTIWVVTWTFLTSFFTSLIPDSPNAI